MRAHLARAQHRAGQLEAALRSYRTALALDPDDASARINVAKVLEQQGALDEAEAAYRSYAKQRPNNAEARALPRTARSSRIFPGQR